jgi:predicted nucleic acid-binding protein
MKFLVDASVLSEATKPNSDAKVVAWLTTHETQLLAELRKQGRAMPVKDSLIAATARQYQLPVATRNSKDFTFAGVKVVNPFE